MKMNEQPLISVIIPVYNTEKFICECVDSVLNQTYRNIEVILVDDGSLDGCPEICDTYADKDSRVRVIHKKNGGLSYARNCGIRNAAGEYLTFVDSDDVISSDMIQYLYRLCIQYDVLLAQCNFIKENAEFDIITKGQEHGILVSKERCINECISNIAFCVSWGKLFHRTVAEKVSFPVGRIHEDVYTTHLFFEIVEKISFTTKRLYYYRQHNSSLMAQARMRPDLEEIRADMTRAKYFKEKGYLEAYRKQLWVCICVLKEQYSRYDRQLSLKQKKQMKKIYRNILFELIKQGQKKIPFRYWILDNVLSFLH